MFVRHGFPVLSLPLPSRREVCEFTLRPYLQTVGTLLNDIKVLPAAPSPSSLIFLYLEQVEDGGVDRVAIYSCDGQRVSQSTSLDLLLQGDFDIEINDMRHKIEVPEEGREREREGGEEERDKCSLVLIVYSVPVEGERALSDVKNMIHKLYISLSVDKHQV